MTGLPTARMLAAVQNNPVHVPAGLPVLPLPKPQPAASLTASTRTGRPHSPGGHVAGASDRPRVVCFCVYAARAPRSHGAVNAGSGAVRRVLASSTTCYSSTTGKHTSKRSQAAWVRYRYTCMVQDEGVMRMYLSHKLGTVQRLRYTEWVRCM